MTHYTNTNNPIDFPKKKKIPMLERFATQSLVEHEGELIFSKEKFAELIVEECINIADKSNTGSKSSNEGTEFYYNADIGDKIKQHFGVEE